MKAHYEKIITLCCFLFVFTNMGLISTSFGVYQPYIVRIVGDTGAMTVLAVRTLTSLISMVFVDRYYRLFDCRLGVSLATFCTAAALILYGFSSTLPLFLIGAVFGGMGYSLGGMVGMTMLTRRWHRDHIGSAVGFASVGSGIAAILVPIVAVRIIENVSLQASFLSEGALALTMGLLMLVFLRNGPADVHETNAGANTPQASTGDKPEAKASIVPQALGSSLAPYERRTLIAAMVCVGAMSVGGPSYLTVYLSETGMNPVSAATLLSTLGLCLTISKYGTGKLFDAVGTRRGSAIVFSCAIAGLAGLLAEGLGVTGIAVPAVVAYGVGLALGTVGVSVWSLEFSNPANIAKSIKNYQVAYAFGGFLANTYPGPLKELTGSYFSTYALMLMGAIFATAIVVGVYAKYRNRPIAR
jgi:MFS family permease